MCAVVRTRGSKIAVLLDMLDEEEKDLAGLPVTVRKVFFIGPDKKIKLTLTYPPAYVGGPSGCILPENAFHLRTVAQLHSLATCASLRVSAEMSRATWVRARAVVYAAWVATSRRSTASWLACSWPPPPPSPSPSTGTLAMYDRALVSVVALRVCAAPIACAGFGGPLIPFD